MNETVSSDNTITVVGFLVHAELSAAMGLKLIVLLEGAFIEQQVQSLTSSQLSLAVLGINSLLSTSMKSMLLCIIQTIAESRLQGNGRRLQLINGEATNRVARQTHALAGDKSSKVHHLCCQDKGSDVIWKDHVAILSTVFCWNSMVRLWLKKARGGWNSGGTQNFARHFPNYLGISMYY